LRNAATYWAFEQGVDFLELAMKEDQLRWGERNLDRLSCQAGW
jgi:hypothetical protein